MLPLIDAPVAVSCPLAHATRASNTPLNPLSALALRLRAFRAPVLVGASAPVFTFSTTMKNNTNTINTTNTTETLFTRTPPVLPADCSRRLREAIRASVAFVAGVLALAAFLAAPAPNLLAPAARAGLCERHRTTLFGVKEDNSPGPCKECAAERNQPKPNPPAKPITQNPSATHIQHRKTFNARGVDIGTVISKFDWWRANNERDGTFVFYPDKTWCETWDGGRCQLRGTWEQENNSTVRLLDTGLAGTRFTLRDDGTLKRDNWVYYAAQPMPNFATFGRTLFVGPHWIDGDVTMFVFDKDGGCWEWIYLRNGMRYREVSRFTQIRVDARGGASPHEAFELRDNGNRLSRLFLDGGRMHTRKIVAPSPDITGIVWEHANIPDRKIVFYSDGTYDTWSTKDKAEEGRGKWYNLGGNLYGVLLKKKTGGPVISLMSKVSEDRNTLELRWGDPAQEFWKRTAERRTASSSATAEIKHSFSNTLWVFPTNANHRIAFYKDGALVRFSPTGKPTTSTWKPGAPTTAFTDKSTYVLSPDRRSIKQYTVDGAQYVWNYAGRPPLRPGETTPDPKPITNQTIPIYRLPVEEQFQKILAQIEEKFQNPEKIASAKKATIERLKSFQRKTIASSRNTLLVEVVEKHIQTLQNELTFSAALPCSWVRSGRLPYTVDAEKNVIWEICYDHNERIRSIRKSASAPFLTELNRIKRQALSEKNIQLAKQIDAKLEEIDDLGTTEDATLSLFVGEWYRGWSMSIYKPVKGILLVDSYNLWDKGFASYAGRKRMRVHGHSSFTWINRNQIAEYGPGGLLWSRKKK
ncbi:MAG: hypothetical protein LBR07_00055 [Puniceicoccales bacterium]|jgi:hypothetical protein|nr:hypothetical protein [Puniceicoccales bacterium]